MLIDQRAVVYNPDAHQLCIRRPSKVPRDEYLRASLPQRSKKRRGSDSWDLFIQQDGKGLSIKSPSDKPGDDIFIGRLDLGDLGILNSFRRRSGKLAEIYVSKPIDV